MPMFKVPGSLDVTYMPICLDYIFFNLIKSSLGSYTLNKIGLKSILFVTVLYETKNNFTNERTHTDIFMIPMDSE